MNIGYLLLFALGLMWTAVTVTVSEGKRKNCSIPLFYLAGSLFAAVVLLVFIGFDGVREIFMQQKRIALLSFVAGAIFNGVGQAVSMANMKNGGRALALAIPQQAFILPYIWSIFFFNQRFSFVSASGILLISVAILFLSLCRNTDSRSSLPSRRIIIACVAMFFIGVGQIFMMIPTQLSADSALSPFAGTWVIFCTNVLFFTSWYIISRTPQKYATKKSAFYGMIWGVFALLSFYVLLQTLRMLGEINQAGIVFPVAVGVLIVSFTLFTALFYREKLNFKQILAFCVLICGILLSKL